MPLELRCLTLTPLTSLVRMSGVLRVLAVLALVAGNAFADSQTSPSPHRSSPTTRTSGRCCMQDDARTLA